MSVLLLTTVPGLPADDFGRVRSPAGRTLVDAAARHVPALRGLRAVRDPAGWHWPGTSWRGSVSHSGALGAALLADGCGIGIDVQRHCSRTAALRRLGRVLGTVSPDTGEAPGLRVWAEVEALLKARGTAGRRPERVPAPPPWRPGWRRCHDGLWLLSTTTDAAQPSVHLAVAAHRPLALRLLEHPWPPLTPHAAHGRKAAP